MINRLQNNNYITAVPVDFSKMRVGLKTLQDPTFDFSYLKKINSNIANKETIYKAIESGNLQQMREISLFFFKTSGIYSRLCKYMAYLFKYDWLVTPHMEKEEKEDKVLKQFYKVLEKLDNFNVKQFLGEAALAVIRDGCYYGYIVEEDKQFAIQNLPCNYCRSRFKIGNDYVVEFNVKFFDDQFTDVNQRLRILKAFPKDIQNGYVAYKEGRLVPDFQGDERGWYVLDHEHTIKFNLNNEDFPPLISVVPAILDLDEAKEINRQKAAQQLLRILVQKLPLDKNGDLVFDTDEAQALHNNAVSMLNKAIGVDVLTTFADVNVNDLSDRSSVTSIDELEKAERTVYNESGTAQNLFNTNGNIALDRSILNDEASLNGLIAQFEAFLNKIIKEFNTSKKHSFKVQILPTTIYNYKDLSKQYKDLTQLGYSKMLPLIALGQSQSAILATAYFENSVLKLSEILIPPLTSNTISSKDVQGGNSESNGGRPQKPDEEKSDKTLKNIESMS